ncbi:hypothetical protein QVD17_01534 [Tagetes erecta]|uniref:Uncharacterized protein n=1 Tax=Tagetes erecta TaxID=13708 RepID=A0AAD8P1K6_TARER|nr:hypothetical protein QVD17_01534 [Tagetes erecta]
MNLGITSYDGVPKIGISSNMLCAEAKVQPRLGSYIINSSPVLSSSTSTSLRSGHRNRRFRSLISFLLSSSGELGFFVCNHGGGFGAIYQLSFCSFK